MHFDTFPDFNRKSIVYIRSSERLSRNDPWGSLYGHMFVDDVRLYVMPIGGKSRARPDFSIESMPDNPTIRRILLWALASRDHYHQSDLQRTISDFIQESAFALAYKGIVHYEITKGEWPEEVVDLENIDKETIASVQPFRPQLIQGHVIRFGKHYLQVVPPIDWPDTEKRLAAIPASDVWLLRVPKELGGDRGHREFLRTLVRASFPSPEFVRVAMKSLSEIKDFNFLDFYSQQLLAVASESAVWGWKARDLWGKETLEYFRIYRHLRFALSMAILREYIVNSMNVLLQKAGIPARIALKGLPTERDVRNHIAELEKGKMTFDDAWKAVEI